MSEPVVVAQKTWKVGTLTYTRAGLFKVFFWMLWGDFCLHLMDMGVVPTLFPLQLQEFGASNTLYGFIQGTVVNLMFFVLVPIVSTASDRYRSKLGRRIPFLLVPTPFLAICLILLGFSGHIARLTQGWFPGLLGEVPVATIALTLACVFFVAFKFFDMFPQSIYYYMWADVIPGELMGTFGALFRVFYAGGSLVFNFFLIHLAKQHPEWIYMGSALLYMVSFLLLCVMVKEGQYPPPPPAAGGKGIVGRVNGFFDLTRQYMVQCFAHAFWWKYFLMNAAFQCGYQPFMAFLILFGRRIYGDTPEGLGQYGFVMSIRDIMWIFIYLALVPIMLKLHPLRAAIGGYMAMGLGAGLGFFFIHDEWTFKVFILGTFVAVAFYLGGTAAIGPKLLPREQYGQFASAGAMIFRLSVALATPALGLVLDLSRAANGGEPAYTLIFLWLAAFCAIGLGLAVWLYFDWKKLGGDENYQAPAVTG